MKHYLLSGQIYAYEADGSQDSLIVEGMEPLTDEQLAALRNPPLTDEQKIEENIAAIQAELDRQAIAKGYDNIVSACSYAPQPPSTVFQPEGAAFLQWRGAVWEHAFAVLNEVKAGNRLMPTPEEAVSELPPLILP